MKIEHLVHVCYSKNRIYKGWFKQMQALEGRYFVRPQCSRCFKLLRVGDFVDGHYPYEQEHNRCNKCVNNK